MRFTSVNPATGAIGASYEGTAPDEIEAIIANADRAFREWRALSFARRAAPMRAAGGIPGRELSHYGIKEFVNIKSIVVQDLR
jgi:succinate-semialdehyde dehydrogenase/glutarate-semialdehyde dehydrogenase